MPFSTPLPGSRCSTKTTSPLANSRSARVIAWSLASSSRHSRSAVVLCSRSHSLISGKPASVTPESAAEEEGTLVDADDADAAMVGAGEELGGGDGEGDDGGGLGLLEGGVMGDGADGR